jgi:pimeloyl-ACP methyl ester carboxylesterase
MASYRNRYGPHNPEETYIPHAFPEQLADLGEVQMNYVTVGDASKPALLLIPGQTESWWGYEEALPLLADHFQAFVVDLRGQGRSSRTPGRYTLDNMGNDLVRFIDVVIGRPTIVSGLSSGGVLSAWLSAYAKPGQVVGAHYEDPPLFASELTPATGQGMRHGIGPMFRLWSMFLGDQWSIGDWDGVRAAAPDILPTWMQGFVVPGEEPPQNLKEYDPEWGRVFWTGTVAASCDHERMLRSVKVPVLLTHHFRVVDEEQGFLMGAMSDLHARRVVALLGEAGVAVDYRSFEQMGHSMHGQDPQLFTDNVVDWASGVPAVKQ